MRFAPGRPRVPLAHVVLCLLAAATVVPHGLDAQRRAPALLVVVVVDQMRADYLARFERHWRGGFRTLLDEGAVFENARYPYLNTWTCAGHATISTGTLPRTHGMIANGWWDRDLRRSIACTEDAETRNISYGSARTPREPASGDDESRPTSGDSAARLLAPTLAEDLRAQQPDARVVTVSLKARSAIGLAGHVGDAVVWFDTSTGVFTTSTAYTDAPVPAVTAFVDRNPVARDLNRAWSLAAPPGAYLARDAGVGERPPAGWSGVFPHAATGRDEKDGQFYRQWEYTPFADEYVARMAAALVDSLALGQRDTTDFLGISFSVLDRVGHTFGPDSREVEDLLRRLDLTLGALIARLDAEVGRPNYRLALSADHGVSPIAMAPRGGRIFNEDIRERVDEALTDGFGPLQRGSYVDYISGGEIVMAPGVFERLRRAPLVMSAAERAVADLPGVSRVVRADEVSDTSLDAVLRAAALSHVDGRSGDLKVIPTEYWYFSARNGGDNTTHGSLHDYDQLVPLILFGGGVPASRRSSPVTPADIAPTLARWAGIRMPTAEGHVLLD